MRNRRVKVGDGRQETELKEEMLQTICQPRYGNFLNPQLANRLTLYPAAYGRPAPGSADHRSPWRGNGQDPRRQQMRP